MTWINHFINNVLKNSHNSRLGKPVRSFISYYTDNSNCVEIGYEKRIMCEKLYLTWRKIETVIEFHQYSHSYFEKRRKMSEYDVRVNVVTDYTSRSRGGREGRIRAQINSRACSQKQPPNLYSLPRGFVRLFEWSLLLRRRTEERSCPNWFYSGLTMALTVSIRNT